MIATCKGVSEGSDPSVAGTATFDIGLSQNVFRPAAHDLGQENARNQ
jgi:hypothetical protein